MKRGLLYITFSLLVTIGYSQEVEQKLLKVYSSEEIAEMKKKDAQLYKALINGFDNIYYIAELPSGKETENLPSITIPKDNFSFESLGIKIIEDQNQYFKINGTNKLLVVKSGLVLKNELNNKQQ